MAKKKKDEFIDDGRTIVSMDFDKYMSYGRVGGSAPPAASPGESTGFDELTKDEMRIVRRASLKAGLLVALVVAAAMALFILFCTKVWFN
ncbi:MAG: hypothetical protein GX337_08640 [Christensenellaceae bacterium]|nr:hypothetical protein [Christensenellaceae bacterium]